MGGGQLCGGGSQWSKGAIPKFVEHVGHVLVDGGLVGKAINSLSILCENRELEGLGGTVPAQIAKMCTILQTFADGCFLDSFFGAAVGALRHLVSAWYDGCGDGQVT